MHDSNLHHEVETIHHSAQSWSQSVKIAVLGDKPAAQYDVMPVMVWYILCWQVDT